MPDRYEADVVFSCGADNFLPDVDVWIVIDVLRATTVMTRWFELGGMELYPVKTPDDARNLVQDLKAQGSSPLLMGEVNGLPPKGFDMGNSPVELNYSLVQEHYCGVMSTTNGTVALCQAAATGTPVLAASLRNYSAVLDYALTLGSRVGLLCSGRKGRPSWEDTLCAGAILEEFSHRGNLYMSDSAKMALTLWQTRGENLTECVMKSNHAVYLEQIGFSEDIAFCCKLDESTVVPMLVTEQGRNILRSVSGTARPYQKPHEPPTAQTSHQPHENPVTETLQSHNSQKNDPFEDLLSYTRKK